MIELEMKFGRSMEWRPGEVEQVGWDRLYEILA